MDLGEKTGMDMGQNRRIEKKRGRNGLRRKIGLDVGQNRRLEKKRVRRGLGDEDRDRYGRIEKKMGGEGLRE